MLELIVDRAKLQIVLHGLEGGLDLDELDVEPPKLGRVFAGEIGAQQIAAFAPPHLAQLGAITREPRCARLRGAAASPGIVGHRRRGRKPPDRPACCLAMKRNSSTTSWRM